MSTGLMHLTFVQILLGALVAGIDAGRTYTGWPTMGGEWIPSMIWDAALGWRNFFENPALVQFVHRMAGYLLAVFAVVVWLRARRSPHPVTRGAFMPWALRNSRNTLRTKPGSRSISPCAPPPTEASRLSHASASVPAEVSDS